MKIILSKKIRTKKRKRKDCSFYNYWLQEEPKKYVDMLTAHTLVKKQASNKLKEIDFKGVLKQTEDGFVYVEIDNGIIDAFYEMLDEKGIQKPPYNGKNGIGAHISVMYKEEVEDIDEIDELWEDIEFKIGGAYSTKPEGWDDMERVWFVEVFSDQLEKIRKKYDLPKKIRNHEFHITFACRRKK